MGNEERSKQQDEQDEWAWLERFAEALGEGAPGRAEIGAMLRLSRDVAHRVERKMAPLAAFVAGLHVGRRAAEGVSGEVALMEVTETAARLVPPEDQD